MTKQVILLVHGMGTHRPGEMTETFVSALNDRARCFGLKEFDVAKEACLVAEFNYSERFDAVRKQFADNAAARREGFGSLAGAGFAAELVTELTALAAKFGNDDFLYTHWLDVLLYATTYYGAAIRAELAETLNKLARKHGHGNIHVVGHSLGTAVVHDTLASLYRDGANIFDNIPDYRPGNSNMKTLWMFANVSGLVHLLNQLEDPMTSTVAPGASGCTDYLFNVRHTLDPFTWFERYDRQMPYLEHIENSTVCNLNTHDLYEYVTAPNVAKRLLRFIFDRQIDKEPFNHCSAAYEKRSLKQGVTELKDALEAVRDKPDLDTLNKAYHAFKVLTDTVEGGLA